MKYIRFKINELKAEKIVREIYGITGKVISVDGEIDCNFQVKTPEKAYVLKVSKADTDRRFLDFQVDLLTYLEGFSEEITAPAVIKNKKGNYVGRITDEGGNKRWVRLYSWIEGRLWSSLDWHPDELLHSLGKEAGRITLFLRGYDHPAAHRKLEWDISQADWTIEHSALLDDGIRDIATFFQKRFVAIKPFLMRLRKGVIHNDANDRNIIVSEDSDFPVVKAIIDYGDAVHTALINNVAVTVAYAAMGKEDPLPASLPLLKGYHEQFPLQEEELELLYDLVAMRLVISLTKSAINRKEEPENTYLQISEQPARQLLLKWYKTDGLVALAAFRKACGFGLNYHLKSSNKQKENVHSLESLLSFRRKHLGRSLSLSYRDPLKIVRGEGAFLVDHTGRKYLDTVNNVAHAGHEHPRVVKAGQRQMALLNTNTRYLHDNIIDFSRELLATFDKKLSVVHFVNSGSEANELALRMAKAYTSQKDMIALEMAYHGNTNACIDISSYKFDRKGGGGCPEHTWIVPMPDKYRGKYTGENVGKKYAEHVVEQIRNIRKKERGVAAFIFESIMSCGGQIELPEHFLELACEAVHKAGGVCIADEVQVGLGRVGEKFWGYELHDIVPDIVTIGKPIGNGHPLAAVVCTQEVADAFSNGMEYFNTFGGNPVSCAIGLEVLRVIREEGLQENALRVGNYLKEKLRELQKEFSVIGDVRGQGLFLGIELADENKNPQGAKAAYLVNRMKELGVLMSTDGPDNNVLKIKPPPVFSLENARELLDKLRMVFNEDFMR